MVEHATVNRVVVGSSPTSGARNFKRISEPKMTPVYWTYVLQNPAGKFYVGHTESLERRLEEHNTPQVGKGRYTHKNGPWDLVWREQHLSRALAMKREKEIKGMKSARWIREELLNGRVPTSRD
jgi:putative endonuclease